MPTIIVTTDPTEQRDAPVLLEEQVYSAHLASDHSAAQLVERLGWAIDDAENTQQAQPASERPDLRRPAPRQPSELMGGRPGAPALPLLWDRDLSAVGSFLERPLPMGPPSWRLPSS